MIDMTEAEFLNTVLEVFPDAELGDDLDGQLVIYTNCHTTLVAGEWRVQTIEGEV